MLLREVEQAAHGAGEDGAAPQVQGVEQADLDLRVGRQGGDDLVQAVAGGVVQQDTHPHAAIGGLEQFVHQHPCADAVVDDVVLQVEAALRAANQFGPGDERLGAVGQQAKARASLVGSGLGLDRLGERRVGGGQGLAGPGWRWWSGAAAEPEAQQQKQGERLFTAQVGSSRITARGTCLAWDERGRRQSWMSLSSWLAAAPTLRTASSICGVGLAA